MAKTLDFLNGSCRQWLLSPKGDIEGVLLTVKRATVQLTTNPAQGNLLYQATAPGKRLRVLAARDQSAKAADGAHPVYAFVDFAGADGQAVPSPAADPQQAKLKGVVAALHYARHGQPNGVVLEGGEFIHLRPHGMALAGLGLGSKVQAVGQLKRSVLGTVMMEAHQVNKISID